MKQKNYRIATVIILTALFVPNIHAAISDESIAEDLQAFHESLMRTSEQNENALDNLRAVEEVDSRDEAENHIAAIAFTLVNTSLTLGTVDRLNLDKSDRGQALEKLRPSFIKACIHMDELRRKQNLRTRANKVFVPNDSLVILDMLTTSAKALSEAS